jgi:hypothetical protein
MILLFVVQVQKWLSDCVGLVIERARAKDPEIESARNELIAAYSHANRNIFSHLAITGAVPSPEYPKKKKKEKTYYFCGLI